MFNHTNVLIAFQCYSSQVENLNLMITIVKNWPDDPQMNCAWYKDMKDFMTIETSLAEDNYDLIEKACFFEQLELDGD